MDKSEETGNSVIEVCAAVVRRNGLVFISSRPQGKHGAGFWEFPGGKRHAGETDAECLRREIREELHCDIIVLDPIFQTSFQGRHRTQTIKIIFLRAFFADETQPPCPRERQEMKWIRIDELKDAGLLTADISFASFLNAGTGQ